jgi:hypothetical protein
MDRVLRAIVGSALIAALLGHSALAGASPVLTLAGAASTGFAFETTDEHFSHRFRVVSGNDEAVRAFAVEVPDFQSQAGRDIETRWSWESDGVVPTSISPGHSATFPVEATFRRPGIYTTEIALLFGRTRAAFPVRVTRLESPADAPGPAQVEAVGPMQTTFMVGEDPVLRVRLRNLTHSDQYLSGPTLASFGSKRASGDSVQASGPWVSCDIGAGVEVERDGERTIPCAFRDVKTAGRFEGVLRLTQSGRKPVDVTFTLVGRDPWLWAILCISTGVIASYFVRTYQQRTRQRTIQQRDLARVVETLRTLATRPASARPERLETFCWKELEELRTAVRDGDAGLDERIARVQARVALALDIADVAVEIARLSGDDQVDARNTLEGVIEAACASSLDAEAVRTSLVSINVRARERSALAIQLKATRAEVEANRPALPAALRTQLEQTVEHGLREASKQLDADNLPAARHSLSAARLALARLLAQALEGELDGPHKVAIQPATWAALKAELKGRLDAVTSAADVRVATDGYSRVLERYADAVLDALEAAIRTERRAFAAPGAEAKLKELDDMLARLTAARGAAIVVRLREFRALEGELTDFKTAQSSQPTKHTVSLRQPGGATTPAPVLSEMASTAAPAPTTWLASREFQERVQARDELVAVVLLVFAIALGLKVLWFDNPTWGGAEGYLVAFLWGLGVYTVGNVSFAGLAGLRDNLTKAG